MSRTIYNVGFWSGIVAFTFTIAFGIVQVLQVLGVFKFPLDEILIYGCSLGIVLPFIIEMLVLHYATKASKQIWTHGALIFTMIYAVFVTSNYVVQLATVIPMTLKGLGSEVSLFRQTTHSLFWDFDAIGYIFMGLATLFAVPAFENNGFQRWVKYAFLAHGCVTPLIAVVYFYPVFSVKLFILGFPWGITAPLFMLLLGILFKKLAVKINR